MGGGGDHLIVMISIILVFMLFLLLHLHILSIFNIFRSFPCQDLWFCLFSWKSSPKGDIALLYFFPPHSHPLSSVIILISLHWQSLFFTGSVTSPFLNKSIYLFGSEETNWSVLTITISSFEYSWNGIKWSLHSAFFFFYIMKQLEPGMYFVPLSIFFFFYLSTYCI